MKQGQEREPESRPEPVGESGGTRAHARHWWRGSVCVRWILQAAGSDGSLTHGSQQVGRD